MYNKLHQNGKNAREPPQPILGCELEHVQRWRGPSTRDKAARDPWKWEEHGLPVVHGAAAVKDRPTKAELDPMTPWQRFKAQTKIDNAAKVRAPHSIDC